VFSLNGTFAYLLVLLRAAALVFELLTVGGVIFLLSVPSLRDDLTIRRRLSRLLACSSALLAVVQVAHIAANAQLLIASTNLTWPEIVGANFCISGGLVALGAALVAVFCFSRLQWVGWPIGCVLILLGTVMASHSVARMEFRWGLAALTLAHHLGGGAWIGGMPYLLLSLRDEGGSSRASAITHRFSQIATISLGMVIGSGAVMSFVYVRSPQALGGTAYGIMLISKVVLTGCAVALGAMNRQIVDAVRKGILASLPVLRRFAEVELGIGITITLAAASLTSSPPAVDLQVGRVTWKEIAERTKPVWPRMQTPPVNQLAPASPIDSEASSLTARNNELADIAWSEYNHHWAGLVVLAAGFFAVIARFQKWARYWPLAFLGLAVFLLVRADAENWPLGPRGFWESFQVAEVAQHRLFVLLIVLFAVFEWRVQSSTTPYKYASLVFPAVCALGGGVLLTHSHSFGNIKEEFLAELSHLPIAVLGVLAGWSRWLELRMPKSPFPKHSYAGVQKLAGWIWPVCFLSIGAILINYREL
jgi:putative copper resistance protein D